MTWPLHAHVTGMGRMRVLGYEGDGRWRLLTRHDTQVVLHRDRFQFTRR